MQMGSLFVQQGAMMDRVVRPLPPLLTLPNF
jgi:hypothetical protein